MPESKLDADKVEQPFALPESKLEADKLEQQFALLESTTLVHEPKTCEPIIELPASPKEHEQEHEHEKHDEYVDDCNDIEDIPTIMLNHQAKDYYAESYEDISLSTTIIPFYADNIPMPKMKDVSRLKTERLV